VYEASVGAAFALVGKSVDFFAEKSYLGGLDQTPPPCPPRAGTHAHTYEHTHTRTHKNRIRFFASITLQGKAPHDQRARALNLTSLGLHFTPSFLMSSAM
jgi:hypothetical protein